MGGVWLYQQETEDDPLGADPHRRRVFSSMYAGLRTNLPRRGARPPGLGLPATNALTSVTPWPVRRRPDNGTSGAHAHCREIMAFSDFPFLPSTMGGLSTDDRTFPGHEEVRPHAGPCTICQLSI